MSKEEVLQEISLLSSNEKKEVLNLLKESLEKDSKAKMANAVEEMLVEYKTNKELTAFTSIDFDDFYEAK